jgi:hypothetical protein
MKLELTISTEDTQEDAGRLSPDDRTTCHTCRIWATSEHLTSASHVRRTQP